MLAYKCLDRARSPFTGWRWEVPANGRPGPWLDVDGPLGLCHNGVHACRAAQLPPWIGNELWTVELAGEIVEEPLVLIASRARLLEPVLAWDLPARVAFAHDCVARAGGHGAPVAPALGEFMAKMAAQGVVTEAGYWSAVLAGEAAAGQRRGDAYEQAFAAERTTQAERLAAMLDLRW